MALGGKINLVYGFPMSYKYSSLTKYSGTVLMGTLGVNSMVGVVSQIGLWNPCLSKACHKTVCLVIEHSLGNTAFVCLNSLYIPG